MPLHLWCCLESKLKSGQIDLAESNFIRAVEINNTYPSPLYYLGVISEKKDPDEARQYYQKALTEAEKRLRANSERGSDHYLLFQICQRLGLQEKAEQFKKSAAELHFTHEAPWKPGVKPLP
jgi:tetratricopeptide (TPR) repeat protein